jgi:hypothetical protein
MEEGRLRERSSAALGSLQAHMLGLAEEDEEAEVAARAATARAPPRGIGRVSERGTARLSEGRCHVAWAGA